MSQSHDGIYNIYGEKERERDTKSFVITRYERGVLQINVHVHTHTHTYTRARCARSYNTGLHLVAIDAALRVRYARILFIPRVDYVETIMAGCRSSIFPDVTVNRLATDAMGENR